jgi:5'-nucleotidase
MRVLLDMDGVMADLMSHWADMLNRYHNANITVDDFKDWKVEKAVPHLTYEQVHEFLADPGFFLHLQPIPGAIEAVKDLMSDGQDVVFVTYCRAGHEDKRKWVERHLPGFPMANIIFAERKELIQGDVLVDDGLHNLEAWQAEHPTGVAVAFDTPYNQSWHGPRITDWSEFTGVRREAVLAP